MTTNQDQKAKQEPREVMTDAEIDAVFASHWTTAETLQKLRRIGEQAKLANALPAVSVAMDQREQNAGSVTNARPNNTACPPETAQGETSHASPAYLIPSDLLERFPEINPRNYDSDDVATLNQWGIDVVLTAVRATEDYSVRLSRVVAAAQAVRGELNGRNPTDLQIALCDALQALEDKT